MVSPNTTWLGLRVEPGARKRENKGTEEWTESEVNKMQTEEIKVTSFGNF